MKIVIKLGGAALEDKSTLQKCAHSIVELANDGHRVTVVHGGGAALTRTLKLLGKESDFVNGLRITDAETRDVALMVLAGMVNKSLVAAIVAAAVRQSASAAGTACRSAPARSRRRATTSGYVGEICSVEPRWLDAIWGQVEFPCCHR